MPTKKQDPEDVRIDYGNAPDLEYRFATAYAVEKPGTIVYLDFAQYDPVAESHRGLARIAMPPHVARDLNEKLSELLAESDDG